MHISVQKENGVLWDMGQVHFGICEIGLLPMDVIAILKENI